VFAAPGLAVSVPVRELAEDPPAGSLYGLDDLARARISSDLRVAVGLIETACRQRSLPLLFITRPEIFTNSASLAWLQAQLRGVQDHLCISDGMTIRVVPEMRNHVFLYRPGVQSNTDGFTRLMRRAPEFISTMSAQVNTAFGVRLHARRVAPPTLVIAAETETAPAEARLYPFYLNRQAAARSAAVSLSSGGMDPGALGAYRRTVYVPLTEVAARDAAFADVLASLLLQAYFDPTMCVVMRLPHLASGTATVADRITTAVAGLCVARVGIPRVVADNIVYTTEDARTDWLCGPQTTLEFLAHEAFDFWRHTSAFYARCQSMTVHAPWRRRGDRAGIRAALCGILGRSPELRWLPADPHDP
jgi:hypothetical protein